MKKNIPNGKRNSRDKIHRLFAPFRVTGGDADTSASASASASADAGSGA